ncbi:MAG TPA: hypothetical protein VFM14_09960 [Gemmatimonadales bacterium]|nr:hypothetical protein [Gemmatimonadales bacterium]
MHATFTLVLSIVAGYAGFRIARDFVRRRLRFVDAVRSPWAPWIAGLAAGVLALPLTLVPLVPIGTLFVAAVALGIGMGTASGARALDRTEWSQRHLLP